MVCVGVVVVGIFLVMINKVNFILVYKGGIKYVNVLIKLKGFVRVMMIFKD